MNLLKLSFLLLSAVINLLLSSCRTCIVSTSHLLDEMVDIEKSADFPSPFYTCKQVSSYDRRTVAPDKDGWFANNDGFGIVSSDTVNGVARNVMFDQEGPGAITRIWITTSDKTGTLKFYFDGASDPQWVISGYDLMNTGLTINGSLALTHTHYKKEIEKTGGNTLFFPIPYAKKCRIVFEHPASMKPTPRYYQINYRTYKPGTRVKTFSIKQAEELNGKIINIGKQLNNPEIKADGEVIKMEQSLSAKSETSIALPEGQKAIYSILFNIKLNNTLQYAQVMRHLILKISFDGKETVWVPLSDFSGGGMGSPEVKSWFLNSDGKGNISSRWIMPYKESCKLSLSNIGSIPVETSVKVIVKKRKWGNNSLYFHTSWRQERGIYVHYKPDETAKCKEWNFATLRGRGIYKGDLLSLYNHTKLWYGEGDEKIWVDDDSFPSHIGTGTEDYYNCSWAPVIPFHTPFGGAPRADFTSSNAYNAFLRTRNLDGIPFTRQLKFDIEMLAWISGTVDYATTIYWYGDIEATAIGTSGAEEAGVELLPKPSSSPEFKHFIEK